MSTRRCGRSEGDKLAGMSVCLLVMPQTSMLVAQTTRPFGTQPPTVNRTRFILEAMLNLFNEKDG